MYISVGLQSVDHSVTIQLLDDDENAIVADPVEEGLDDEEEDEAEEEMGEQELQMRLNRVNNAFVRQLTLSFRLEDLALLRYLRANAGNMQCRIGTVRLDGQKAAVDFLGVHLKPQICKTGLFEHREDYAMLIAHNALRGNVKHFVYEVYEVK